MDPLNPWLDADEVRRMALRLIRPVADTAGNMADAGYGESFVGFIQPDPTALPPAQEPPAAVAPADRDTMPIPAPALTRAAQVPTPVSDAPLGAALTELPAVVEPVPPSTSTARGPFLDRIRHFRDWLGQEFSAAGVFIIDREGSVIFDESELGRLHFLARSLALASRRPGSSAANVHVKIGAGTTLEVIPVETAYGCMVLGALVPEALSPAAVNKVMVALAQVATPPA